jgi:hypothetical protein
MHSLLRHLYNMYNWYYAINAQWQLFASVKIAPDNKCYYRCMFVVMPMAPVITLHSLLDLLYHSGYIFIHPSIRPFIHSSLVEGAPVRHHLVHLPLHMLLPLLLLPGSRGGDAAAELPLRAPRRHRPLLLLLPPPCACWSSTRLTKDTSTSTCTRGLPCASRSLSAPASHPAVRQSDSQ